MPVVRVKLLTLYLEPETGQVILETAKECKSMSLSEFRNVVENIRSWEFDVAETVIKNTGWKGKSG